MTKEDLRDILESEYKKVFFSTLFSTTKISIKIIQRGPKMLGLNIKSFLWNDSEKARKSCKGIQRKQDSAAGRKNRMAFPSWFPAQLLRMQAFKDVHITASGTLVYHSDGLIVGVC